ncbi:MAG: hypothetical protein ACXACD_01145 [Candidatus Thorarchaeota archaeon]|jgi:hypothetical protein
MTFAGYEIGYPMSDKRRKPLLAEENWNSTADEVQSELQSFIDEFGAFTPEWFVDIKFHLLRESGLTKASRDELCRLSIHARLCPKCDFLYIAKKCLLWLRLFRINPRIVERAPPCIQDAFKNNAIKIVADFLVVANLIDPPFYKVRSAPWCRTLRGWGYCTPDEYCEAMERANTLEYSATRERVKRSRDLPSE